jgi:O-antigen/teichoic acid export membrane protein
MAFEGFGALAPLAGLIVGYVAGLLVGLYFVAGYHNVKFRMPTFESIRKILNFSAPIAVSSIVGSFSSNIALIFVGYFVAAGVIGNIGLVTKTSSLVTIISDSIGVALLPAFSAALANRKLKNNIGELYGYSVYIAVALMGPILFYVMLFSAPFMHLIFGASYSLAPLYVTIMCAGIFVWLAGSYAYTLLISAGEVKLILKYSVAVSLTILLLIVVLVPLLGSIAYVILTFFGLHLLYDVLLIRKLFSKFKVHFKLKKLYKLVVANAIVSVVAFPLYWIFGGVSLLVAGVILFLILYPLISTLIGGIDRGDIATIKAISKEIPLVGVILEIIANYANMLAR